jgi:hypothetical protein
VSSNLQQNGLLAENARTPEFLIVRSCAAGGAFKGTSSPLEQKPVNLWNLLYKAADQVACMRAVNSMLVQANSLNDIATKF